MVHQEMRQKRIEYNMPPPPSRCAKFLYYTWKLCSVVFSHLVMISLVVAYCVLGAVTFERLEAEHEKEVKRNISRIRNNTTASIWGMTQSVPLLNHTNWTSEVVLMLKDFESSILLEMKARGWDGNESTDHIQWTFTGALFYSIIVITTIGYGHIAPKTQTGKVVTIFYAILGIPLMLLCLSNIGDVMASCFRFLYWRVCCYLCTRPPQRRRRRVSTRRSLRSRPTSTRRKKALERAHSDTDFRYRDSGYSSGRRRRLGAGASSHSLRAPRTRSQPPAIVHDRDIEFEGNNNSHFELNQTQDELQFENEIEHEFPKVTLPLEDLNSALKDLEKHHMKIKAELRSRSLPRTSRRSDRKFNENPRNFDNSRTNFDTLRGNFDTLRNNSERNLTRDHDLNDVDYDNFRERKAIEDRYDGKRKRVSSDFDTFRDRGYDPEDDEFEFDVPIPRYRRTWDERRGYRGHSEFFEHPEETWRPRRSRRAKSVLYDTRDWDDAYEGDRGIPQFHGGRRQLRRLQTVDADRSVYVDRYSPSPVPDEWSEDEYTLRRGRYPASGWPPRHLEIISVHPEPIDNEEIKPVPIWLCVFLVASYIVVGTFLFTGWEGWPYLDAAYFCFITLTTIGFGDFVPAQGAARGGGADAAAAVHSIALCSLYLLFGIALLAMSFNLVQEQARAAVAAVAASLGIIKPRARVTRRDGNDI